MENPDMGPDFEPVNQLVVKLARYKTKQDRYELITLLVKELHAERKSWLEFARHFEEARHVARHHEPPPIGVKREDAL